MIFSRYILILYFSFSCISTGAQTRPAGMSDMTLYKNVGSFLKKAVPTLQSKAVGKAIADKIDAKLEIIEGNLKWSKDGGYLIRVRVYDDPLTGNSVALEPDFFGVGIDPKEIVAATNVTPTLTNAPPTNLRYSVDRSFYIWATMVTPYLGGKSGKIQYGFIVGTQAQKVNLEALNLIANKELVTNLVAARRLYYLEGIIQNLKTQVVDQSARARIATNINEYKAGQEKLTRLKDELNRDLARINEANKLKETLSALSSVLSVASTSLQISASLDDVSASDLSNATTPGDFRQIVEDYIVHKDGSIQYNRSEISIQGNRNSIIQGELRNDFNQNGVPADFIRNIIEINNPM